MTTKNTTRKGRFINTLVMLVTLILFACLFLLVYAPPAWLILRLLGGEPSGPGRGALAIALGGVVVHTITVFVVGLAGLFMSAHVTWPVVVGVSFAVSGALASLAARRGVLAPPRLSRLTRERVALGLVTLLSTVFFLAYYDTEMFSEDSCIVRASSSINFDYMQGVSEASEGESSYRTAPMHGQPTNPFLTHNQGQRLGPGVVVAPFVALFGRFGYRLAYAIQGLLLPGLGLLLGRRVLGGVAAPWLVAVMLTFSPYALDIRTFDENFMGSVFGTLTLVLLLGARAAPFAAGVAFSLVLGIRHVGVLILPGLAWYLYKRREELPARALLRFAAGLILFSLPYLVLHAFILAKMGTLFEGALERPPAPHALFGISFELPVLLNFPFVSEPLRSPYVGLPNLVLFPLDLVRRFGAPLMALVPIGAWRLFRQDRARATLLAWWFLSLLLLVMVQSNWIEPNKMGVPATVLAPLVLWIVAGAVWLVDNTKRIRARLAWVGGGILLTIAAVLLLGRVEAPRDERVLGIPSPLHDKIFPPSTVRIAPETSAYVEWDRQRYDLALFPTLGTDWWRPPVLARDLEEMVDAVARPSVSDYQRPTPDSLQSVVLGSGLNVAPMTLFKYLEQGRPAHGLDPIRLFSPDPVRPERTRSFRLDLETPPVLADIPLDPIDNGDLVDVTAADGRVFWVGGLRVPWSEESENLLVARDRFGTVFLLLMPGTPNPADFPAWLEVVPVRVPPDARAVRIALPVGEVVRLIDVRGFRPALWYMRSAIVDEDGVHVYPTWTASPG